MSYPALRSLLLLCLLTPALPGIASAQNDAAATTPDPAAAPAPAAERPPVSVVVRQPVEQIASQRFRFRVGRGTFTVPCESTVSMTSRTPGIRHLVIMVHGLFRQPHYHFNILKALELANSPADVAVISPQFLVAQDVIHHRLDDDYPYWSVNGWQIGHLSRNDPELPRSARISSFEVTDALLSWAAQALPDLESIAVCGFSAGGQYAGRYAASNHVHSSLTDRGINVVYVVGGPSHYVYLNGERMVDGNPPQFAVPSRAQIAECPNYNNYPFGLEELNEYMSRGGGAARIRRELGRRSIILLCGEEDDARASYGLASGCSSNMQGAHRLERAVAYREHLLAFYGPSAQERVRLVVVPGAGHNSLQLFASPLGVQALLDNYRRPAASGSE